MRIAIGAVALAWVGGVYWLAYGTKTADAQSPGQFVNPQQIDPGQLLKIDTWVVGCKERSDVLKYVELSMVDYDAMMGFVTAQSREGRCVLLKPGAEVFVKAKGSSNELARFRPKGDFLEYWTVSNVLQPKTN